MRINKDNKQSGFVKNKLGPNNFIFSLTEVKGREISVTASFSFKNLYIQNSILPQVSKPEPVGRVRPIPWFQHGVTPSSWSMSLNPILLFYNQMCEKQLATFLMTCVILEKNVCRNMYNRSEHSDEKVSAAKEVLIGLITENEI